MKPELYKNRFRSPSARLVGYDYSSEGYYFVTICVQNFRIALGWISFGEMHYSNSGEIVHQQWMKMHEKFENAFPEEFVVMPDHFHGIIKLQSSQTTSQTNIHDILSEPKNMVIEQGSSENMEQIGGCTGLYNPMLSRHSLSKIVRWFKGSTTFMIRKEVDPSFEWQSRFYDRVIRNDRQLEIIRKYIRNNPVKWKR